MPPNPHIPSTPNLHVIHTFWIGRDAGVVSFSDLSHDRRTLDIRRFCRDVNGVFHSTVKGMRIPFISVPAFSQALAAAVTNGVFATATDTPDTRDNRVCAEEAAT